MHSKSGEPCGLFWAALLLLTALRAGCSAALSGPPPTPLARQLRQGAPHLTLEQLGASLEEGEEQLERRLDRWTLDVTGHWQHHLAEMLERRQLGVTGWHPQHQQERRRRRRRGVDALPEELWHSYTYNTRVGNREELTLHGLYGGRQLNVSGPAADAPPQWQVVSHKGMFYMFVLYPFAGTDKLHLVKTNFDGIFLEHTVGFSAADLRVTPFLHFIHSSHRVQLFLFVKRAVPVTGLYDDDSRTSEQIFCFLVDQATLETTEACAPVTLPSGPPTAEMLVDTLVDVATGAETVALIPVRQGRGLAAYKLRSIPHSDSFNLGLYATIDTKGSVWRVRLFTVSGHSYVVVAYGDGPFDSMIQVFRYDAGKFTLVQTLAVSDYVINIEVFGIGFQHYLVLAQQSRIALYTWHGANFALLQDESSTLTYKWTVVAVRSCRHEVVLVKVFSAVVEASYQPKQVEFYVHNARTGRFNRVASVPCVYGTRTGEGLSCFEQPGDELDLYHLVGVSTENATYIIAPSKLHQLILVTVNASVGFVHDPVWLENKALNERKAALQAQYDASLLKLDRIEAVLDHVIVPGSHQQLQGDYSFLGHITADTLDAPDAAIGRVRMTGFSGDVFRLVAPLVELTQKVAVLEDSIAAAVARLQDVVQIDDSAVVITGQKNVVGGVSVSELEATGALYVNTVGGRDFNNTLVDLVTPDPPRHIWGTKTVASALNVSGELTADQLNGRPVSNIVTLDTIQELSGPLQYAAGTLSMDALSVTGLLGGVRTQELALYGGSGPLPVPVSVDTLSTTNLSVGLLNGQQAEDLFSGVLLSTGGTFTQSVTFEGDVHLQNVQITGTLNGEQVADLLASVVWTDAAQSLDVLRLQNAVVAGSLSPQAVNGQPFPGDRYVTPSGVHAITGAKTLSRVTVARLAAGRLDGLAPTQLVTLDTSQTLERLRLDAAHVLGRLTVGGRVDGVRLAPGWLDHLLRNGTQTLNTTLVFSGSVTQLGDLTAADLDGGRLERLLTRLVSQPPPGQPASVGGRKHLAASVAAGAVTVRGMVNGDNPADWLTLSSDQLVSGLLTLAQAGFFSNLIVAGQVDSVDFALLSQDAIYTTAEHQQLLLGVKAFSDAVMVPQLQLEGALNGRQPAELLWTRGDQTVSGTHTYLGAMRAGGLHARGQLAAAAADGSRTEVLVFDRLEVRGSTTIDWIGEHDLLQLTDGVLRAGGGLVSGRWHFQSLRVNGSVTSAEGAGGWQLSGLRQRLVSLTGVTTVGAPLAFEQLLVTGAAVQGRLWLGGLPWQQVLFGLAQRGDDIVINATKTFTAGLHVVAGIHAASLPLQNALLVGADQVVSGTAFFHNDVTVHASLISQQPVNGEYGVTQLSSLFVTDPDNVTVTGDLVIWGASSISEVSLSGLLGGRPVAATLAAAVPLSAAGASSLSGRLTFTDAVRATTLHLRDGRLNGRHLAVYLATVRLTTDHQWLAGPVVAGAVTLPDATVRHLTVRGLLDGLNCTGLLERVILLDGDYELSGLWRLAGLAVAGDLRVLSLNGQQPAALLRLDGAVTLYHLNVVGDVHAPGITNGSLSTTLNGIALGREFSALFPLHHTRRQIHPGGLIFTGHVVFNGNLALAGPLNDFNVSDVIVLGNANTIVGSFQFSGAVTADAVVLDGTDMDRCAATAVYPDQNVTLHGHYLLTSVGLDGSSIDQTLDMDDSRANVTALLGQCARQVTEFNSYFSSQCRAMLDLYDDMRSTYYALRYFDLVQELTWPDMERVLSSVVVEKADSLHVVVTYVRRSSGCPETRLLQWREDITQLRPVGAAPLATGAVRQWRHLRLAGRHVLVSAAGPAPQGCPSLLSAIWLWSGDTLQLIQSLQASATQVLYTEAPLGLATLLLLDPAGHSLWRLTYHSDSGTFVGGPEPTQAELVAAHQLPDGSQLLLSAEDSTVVVRHETRHQDVQHEQTLGALTATALYTYTLRDRVLMAVGDGGWSSLLNSPQGVKIFEYFGNGTHRCVPVQHLGAVSPADMMLLAAGSLPDLFLAVVERDCGLRLFIDKGEAGFVEFQRLAVPGATAVSLLFPADESPPHLLVTAGDRLVLLAAHMVGARVTPEDTDCAPRLPQPSFGL
ncbi:uncharacterized protein LOC119089400 [Pollicipes pollicipes]|uniref:uncharacterized protein LOC119089400 n=1 Tax=Pollicipes pollicipes TaxID=41117 RepID=UPI00188599B2|nr:uncharacterized protein LOC119089400 [Pollicipes pollicipes]